MTYREAKLNIIDSILEQLYLASDDDLLYIGRMLCGLNSDSVINFEKQVRQADDTNNDDEGGILIPA